MKNRSAWEKAIAQHGRTTAPAEACGAIIAGPGDALEALPLRNVHERPETCFRMDPAEWTKLAAGGRVRAYYHSHPTGPAAFSDADKVMSEETGFPVYLYDVPSDELIAYTPSGWQPPLEGRAFMAGVNDCFSVVRDWHRANTGIELELPPRTSEMMLRGIPNLGEMIERNRLVRVTGQPLKGDLLVMHLRASGSVPNHVAVFIGDGEFLHQTVREPSRRDAWGGYWEHITTMILRPESLIAPLPAPSGTEPEKLDPGAKLSPP